MRLQGLLDQQDCVVHDDTDQDDKPEHREDIELLRRLGRVEHGVVVHDRQPREPTDHRERNTEHDDERIQEALENLRHQQVRDEQRPHETSP